MEGVYVIDEVALLSVAVVRTIRAYMAYTVVLGSALLLAIGADCGYALVEE